MAVTLLDAPPALETLTINEIFFSIQGESTFAGLPCIFVRLTGCDLRCSYCDTEYAFYAGKKQSIEAILAEVATHRCQLVEITGGEPLLQRRVRLLMSRLCDAGYTVLLETSGAHDIAPVDRRVHRIMDLKCPGSGEADRNLITNLAHLGPLDEVKFVISSPADFQWAADQVRAGRGGWADRVHAILFSPVFGRCLPLDLATQLLAERLPGVRLQLQMHKQIWDPQARGV